MGRNNTQILSKEKKLNISSQTLLRSSKRLRLEKQNGITNEKSHLLRDQYSSNNSQFKNCVVKLHRLPKTSNPDVACNFSKDILEESFRQTATEETNEKEQNISTSEKREQSFKIRKCVVKLPKTPLNKGSGEISNKTIAFRNPRLSLTRRKSIFGNLNSKATPNSTNNSFSSTEANTNSQKRSMQLDSIDCIETGSLDLLDQSKRISPKNLRNKPVEIENILQSLECPEDEALKEAISPPKRTALTTRNKLIKSKGATGNRFSKKLKTAEDEYEFLSQSQTSDSDSVKRKDPAADIIRKLIDEGKVAVTRYYKGKPIKKRQYKPRHKVIKNINVIKKKVHFNDQKEDEPRKLLEEEGNTVTKLTNTDGNDKNPILSAKITFSNLARSVLLQNTRSSESMLEKTADRQQFLEVPQKHISTPMKPQNFSDLVYGVDLSPIPHNIPGQKSFTNTSSIVSRPENLNFRDLSTISNIRSMNNKNETLGSQRRQSNRVADSRIKRNIPAQNQESSFSFSSNDSNAENLPPTQIESSFGNENMNLFSGRQYSNPRRSMPHRSPLKTINIIDVVTLPPYKPLNPSPEKNPESNFSTTTNDTEKLFGFEEYLHGSDSLDLEETQFRNHDDGCNASVSKLHKRLKDLKKWRPKELPGSRKDKNYKPQKIFDEFNGGQGVQQNIKEMFCSTMIGNRASNEVTNKTRQQMNSDDDDSDSRGAEMTQSSNIDLFGDPESTLNEASIRRTYVRPLKRKRKSLRPYAFELETDESNDDDDNHNRSFTKKKENHNKKRNRAEENHNAELEKFAAEFNAMCEEAARYELIVE